MNTCNNVHQKWPIYQEFLTHLANFFYLYVYVYKCSVQGQNGSVIRNVHLSSGPLWSALYMDTLLQSLCGVGVHFDDILVTGTTQKDHLINLKEVLK